MTADLSAMPPAVRSALFVPGNQPSWVEKSPQYRADAIVIDLEDATPESEKSAARAVVGELIPALSSRKQRVWVRVNAFESDHLWNDLEAVCQPGVGAICLPKVPNAEVVKEVDRLVTFMEGRRGLPLGSVRIVPLLETAEAIVQASSIFLASNRVSYGGGLASAGGDVQRSVGFRWSDSFQETVVLRSQILLAARAAGHENPLTGLITEVDPDPVYRFAQQSRTLGYAGMFVIHPTHVEIANETFAPTQEEVEWADQVLVAYEAAAAVGKGAVRDAMGSMIDFAHVRTARQIIEAKRRLTTTDDDQ
jgi:citrate lyase subunit beta / citryl-CoA lyase